MIPKGHFMKIWNTSILDLKNAGFFDS